jgi:DNA end-binding protein Ku
MRPMWSGSLSFGLVNIPVNLYKATGEDHPRFHWLHQADLARVRNVRVCEADGAEVQYEDLIHGFEYAKGEYVALTESDLAKANVRKTKTIEIAAFVNPAEIDNILYEQPYYLEPEEGAAKAYSLLCQALRQTDKVGVAGFVFQNRERIGAVRPAGDMLMLEQIRYAAQIRDAAELKIPAEPLGTADELKMATALIKQLAKPFEPESFRDTYREDIDRIVAEKVAGKQTTAVGSVPEPTRAKDLMAALLASLDEQPAPAKKG